jgi:Protein of unknown function (DUF3822)
MNMGRINQEIVEFAFSQKATTAYDLNVMVGSDSIYYLINDAQMNVLALKSFHFDQRPNAQIAANLKATFIDDPLLKETYRSTKIVFSTPHFTLIPTKFYDENQHTAYFENLTALTGYDAISVDPIRIFDVQNVYLIDNQLAATAKTILPSAQHHHIFTSLALGCQKIAEHRGGYQLFANVRDGQLQILFFDGRDFIFGNSFSFKTPQDVIYYLLNCYEQFKLNPEVTPLSISGSLTEHSDIFKYIYRYIRHIGFVPTPPYFRFGQQFTGIPAHFYFDLFSVKLCE